MKSLILITLYLFKDTLYRWKERPASPISRLLVSFFLSLCALSFLANYVLSAKLIRDQIQKNGADLILVYDTELEGKGSLTELVEQNLPRYFDCDVLALKEAPVSGARIGQTIVPVMQYGVTACRELASMSIPLNEHPALLLINPAEPNLLPGPQRVSLQGFELELHARYVPEHHVLTRLYPLGVILVPENMLDTGIAPVNQRHHFIIKVRDMSTSAVQGIDDMLRNVSRMDGRLTMVQSMAPLLKDLDVLVGNQTESRVGFSIGIAVIVGILLTALASMEFRQNEYVYTLMKSFGIRPILLIVTFIVENVFLVGIAFVSAVIFFMYAQKIVLGEFFKIPNAALSYQDIMSDLMLLGGSLLVCVFVSAVPIAFSAYRQIGKVLK